MNTPPSDAASGSGCKGRKALENFDLWLNVASCLALLFLNHPFGLPFTMNWDALTSGAGRVGSARRWSWYRRDNRFNHGIIYIGGRCRIVGSNVVTHKVVVRCDVGDDLWVTKVIKGIPCSLKHNSLQMPLICYRQHMRHCRRHIIILTSCQSYQCHAKLNPSLQ